MINVFIDTNVFLDFYSYSKERLNKLDELSLLINQGTLRLILPCQVIDEFNRNRENKLKKTLSDLKQFKAQINNPDICHDFDEMKQLKKALEDANRLHKKLLSNIEKKIRTKSLRADKLIKKIFSIGDRVDISDSIINKAIKRYHLGNPPGKNNSYGDAINWECLLEKVSIGEDLYFIGRDKKDYTSPIDPQRFSLFLEEEWQQKKKSHIKYYELLTEFIKYISSGTKITNEDIIEEKKIVERSTIESPPYPDDFSLNLEVVRGLEEQSRKYIAFMSSPEYKRSFIEFQEQMDYIRKHPRKFKF